MPARQAEVLVFLCVGLDEEEAAAALELSCSTVHNHASAARHRVLPDALAPSTPNAIAWGWLHSGCCLASSFEAALRTYPSLADQVEILAGHHVESITARQVEVLLLEAFGLTDGETADALYVSPSSVRSTARQARARVVPPELEPGRANATAWTHLHLCVLHRRRGQESRFGEIWRKRLVG